MIFMGGILFFVAVAAQRGWKHLQQTKFNVKWKMTNDK